MVYPIFRQTHMAKADCSVLQETRDSRWKIVDFSGYWGDVHVHESLFRGQQASAFRYGHIKLIF